MERNNKRILVNSRAFDLEDQHPNGNLQDAYLLRFLNEALSDGYEVTILVDENDLDDLHATIEIAAANCLELLGEYIDGTIFEDSIVTNEELPVIQKEDLRNDDGLIGLMEPINPLGDFELVIGPEAENAIEFTGMLEHYVTYISPDILNSIYIFEEYKSTIDNDRDFRDHNESTALESADNQMIMIRDSAFLSKFFKGDHERILADIGRNRSIYDFCNKQSFTVETPSSEKPDISIGEFYLTHYFANLLRSQNPNLPIHKDFELEQENARLVVNLSDMPRGGSVIDVIRAFADIYSMPRP